MQNILAQQLVRSGMLDPHSLALAAFLKVDRGNYCAGTSAYDDTPQSIGHGQTISAPHMHAQALAFAEPVVRDAVRARGTVRVLDVGCGSGYLVTAFSRLGHLAGARDVKVVGLESVRALAELSITNIRASDADLLTSEQVEVHVGDGWKGWRERAPYDFVHVGAAASRFPDELGSQLRVGGRAMVPMGEGLDQTLYLCDKDKDERVDCQPMEAVLFVPLREFL